MVDFADLVIPDQISDDAKARARELLDYLKVDVGRLEEALEVAAGRSPQDTGRANLALTLAGGILKDLHSLDNLGSILPPGFTSCWIEGTNERLQELGASKLIDQPDASGTGHSDSLFRLRPFTPLRPDLNTASKETLRDYLKAMVQRAFRIFEITSWTSLAKLGNQPKEVTARQLAQDLYDEAVTHLEAECTAVALDQVPSLPRPLRVDPEFQETIVTLGVDAARDGFTPSKDEWPALTPLGRAWFVNNLILDMVRDNPERASAVKRRDVIDAANGNPAAWERLRAACSVERDTDRPRDDDEPCRDEIPDARTPSPTADTDVEAPIDARLRVTKKHRQRAPDLTDLQFRRQLDDAGRRIFTGDTSGGISDRERQLIEKNRRLTKRAVIGLMHVGKTAFDKYLSSDRCNIDWDNWKAEIERRHRGR